MNFLVKTVIGKESFIFYKKNYKWKIQQKIFKKMQ